MKLLIDVKNRQFFTVPYSIPDDTKHIPSYTV